MYQKYLFVLPFLLFGGTGAVSAQSSEDHLKPVRGLFDLYDFEVEYYSKVRQILFKDLTDSPEIRFQVLPSFMPEHVLDIQLDGKNKQHYLVYHICQKMIWPNEQWKKIKVDRYKTKIDKASVELIKTLFDLAIAQTKFREITAIGLDGEDYFFSIYENELQSGMVWSPAEGTRMSRLVAIGYDLIELAQSKADTVSLSKELRKNIQQLIEELRS